MPELERGAEEFFREKIAMHIFPPMQELTLELGERGCEVWAVSWTNEWVVRAGARRFGIPPERVLAACAAIEDGRCSSRLLMVPTDEGKAVALREHFPDGAIDAAFGNTIHDVAMLSLAPATPSPSPRTRALNPSHASAAGGSTNRSKCFFFNIIRTSILPEGNTSKVTKELEIGTFLLSDLLLC